MKLECAGSISSGNATEAEVRRAFADDGGRGEFIILSQADEMYIQAAGEADDPYVMEYREGSDDRHFECTRELKKSEAEAAFLKYLKGDSTWKTDFQWKKQEKKPWWKFW